MASTPKRNVNIPLILVVDNRSVADPGVPKGTTPKVWALTYYFGQIFLKLHRKKLDLEEGGTRDANKGSCHYEWKETNLSDGDRCSLLVDKVKIKYVFQQFYLCKRLQNKLKWYSQIVVKVESRTGCNRHFFFNLASLLSVIEMNYASFFHVCRFTLTLNFHEKKIM